MRPASSKVPSNIEIKPKVQVQPQAMIDNNGPNVSICTGIFCSYYLRTCLPCCINALLWRLSDYLWHDHGEVENRKKRQFFQMIIDSQAWSHYYISPQLQVLKIGMENMTTEERSKWGDSTKARTAWMACFMGVVICTGHPWFIFITLRKLGTRIQKESTIRTWVNPRWPTPFRCELCLKIESPFECW